MLELELAREIELEIYFKTLRESIYIRRADFIVERTVLVELKAVIQLEDVHLVQVLCDLKAYKLEIGLSINLGNKT